MLRRAVVVDREVLKGWIREAWEVIPQHLIDKLLLSAPNRVRALRKAKGRYANIKALDARF